MSVHVIADDAAKLPVLRGLIEQRHVVTSETLSSASIRRNGAEAAIVAVDVAAPGNISALKAISARLTSIPKRIFVIDGKGRLPEAGNPQHGQVPVRVEHDNLRRDSLALVRTDDEGLPLPSDDVGVGDDDVGRGREAAAVLDAPAGDALDLDGRRRDPVLHGGRQRDGARRRARVGRRAVAPWRGRGCVSERQRATAGIQSGRAADTMRDWGQFLRGLQDAAGVADAVGEAVAPLGCVAQVAQQGVAGDPLPLRRHRRQGHGGAAGRLEPGPLLPVLPARRRARGAIVRHDAICCVRSGTGSGPPVVCRVVLPARPAWLTHRQSRFVGGRRSRLGADGTPQTGAGAQAA